RAQTISGTLRNTISRLRVGQRSTKPRLPGSALGNSRALDNARVATREQGRARARARVIPAVAMARVSTVALASSATNTGSPVGGQNPDRKLPMVWILAGSSSAARLNSLTWSAGQSRTRATIARLSRARLAGSRGGLSRRGGFI